MRAASGSRCAVGVPTKRATPWASRTLLALVSSCCILALQSSAAAAMIGINFHGGTYGRKIATKEAGVEPQTNWNDVSWAGGSDLRDSAAQATAVSVTTDTTKHTYNSYVSVDPPYVGNDYLMRGYIYRSGASMTVTVAGLGSPFTTHGYDVIVYFDGDNPTDWITAYTLTVGGSHVETIYGKDAKSAGWSGTFVEAFGTSINDATAGNYVRFDGLKASAFTLTATPISGDGPINAIQFVCVPEPASASLLALGLASVFAARVRRRALRRRCEP